MVYESTALPCLVTNTRGKLPLASLLNVETLRACDQLNWGSTWAYTYTLYMHVCSITGYGSTLYIGIAMVFCILPIH